MRNAVLEGAASSALRYPVTFHEIARRNIQAAIGRYPDSADSLSSARQLPGRQPVTVGPEPHGGDDTYDSSATPWPRARAGRCGVWLGDDLAVLALIASLIDQPGRCCPSTPTAPGW